MKTRNILPRAVAVSLLVSAGSAVAGQPLFVGEIASPTASNRAALQSIAARPESFNTRAMRANPAVVSASTQEIQLDLGHRRVNAVLSDARAVDEGGLVWVGRIKETTRARSGSLRETAQDAANTATLVRRDGTVTGNVRVDGRLFRIRPLPGGGHAVIEVDESRMPADHPADYADLPRFDMTASNTTSGGFTTMAISPGTTATIRVMVVATNAAVNAYGGNMRSLMDLAISESNQGYANSNVGINLVLAGYYTTSYTEVGMSTDLSRFRGTSDGYMDGVHSLRNQNAADVVMLIGNQGSSCGLASGIGSTASTAFATTYWNCATGYYSFAHEIGHLQSARHDPAADPSTTPYAYGHGYRAPNNAWRTIMAYACTGGCPRLNYWSNPDKTYNGVAMGTTTQSHNQRVLVNTKATMAGFR
ncbi:M12 family metallo-peptidase [Lysobacter korlensis]|uniref:M12 family metallo-peptidase n=1 Tax=Lysobacter korlensis TaxID=553636 RepID=A0ABV6RJQ7_9GAMM